MSKRLNGSCLWFNNDMGYGFLVTEDGTNYFVHYSSLNMTGYKKLEPGQKVNFELVETEKGIQASDVNVEG